LVFEKDTETYAVKRDEEVVRKCREGGVQCVSVSGHTLWDVDEVIKANGGKPTMTQASLLKVPFTLSSIKFADIV
jgi:cryptochrome